MNAQLKTLEASVLNLPTDDRVRLLESLLASLESQSPSEAAWLAVAQQRHQDVLSGQVALVSADEALTRVRARLAL